MCSPGNVCECVIFVCSFHQPYLAAFAAAEYCPAPGISPPVPVPISPPVPNPAPTPVQGNRVGGVVCLLSNKI